MSNKLLLIQIAVGPTYRERLLHNLNTCKSYDLFDVYIMTEDVEYFDSVKHRPNLFINDLNEIRKEYPWSIELEKIPPKTNDEIEYADLYRSGYRFPTTLERFVWNWEHAERYDGFIFMNCDILPISTEESYQRLEQFFCNPVKQHPIFPTEESLEDKIIVSPGGAVYDNNHWYLKDYAISLNNKLHVTDRPIEHNFPITDGNFKTFKFPDKKMIKPFFELFNNIVYEAVSNPDYFILGAHTIWNVHAEYVSSIIFNLLGNCYVFPFSPHWGIDNTNFAINCYPEDRFWGWCTPVFDCSPPTKHEFIQKNYDNLKILYDSRGQFFPYQRA